jgi:hypothetical protein
MAPLKIFLFAGPLLLAACAEAAERPPTRLMDEIERTIVLEKAFGARWSRPRPLAAYDRYYAWSEDGRTVEAVYTLNRGAAGRHWVERNQLPVVFDGGCSFIRVRYSLKTRHFDEVACNGLA